MAKRRQRPDPFALYLEWAQHRYNPGHYLGGTIEPHLRKASLGPRARRRSGQLLLFSGTLGLLSFVPLYASAAFGTVTDSYSRFMFFVSVGVSLLTISAGVVMFRSAPLAQRDAKPHQD